MNNPNYNHSLSLAKEEIMSKAYQVVKTFAGTDEQTILAELFVEMEDAEDLLIKPKEVPSVNESVGVIKQKLALIENNLPVGLLLLDEHLIIIGPSSEKCKELFNNKELDGLEFIDALGINDDRDHINEILIEYLESIKTASDNHPENPFEIFELKVEPSDTPEEEDMSSDETIPIDSKWLRIRFQWVSVTDGGIKNHVLVFVQDISAAKRKEDDMLKMEQKNIHLQSVAHDPDVFCELLGTLPKMINLCQTDLSDQTLLSISSLFERVLTIKGVADSFGCFKLSECCDLFIRQLETIESESSIDKDFVDSSSQHITLIKDEVNNLIGETQFLLGIDVSDVKDISLRVSSNELKNRMNEINQLSIDSDAKTEILNHLNQLKKVQVYKGLALTLKIIPTLIEFSGKEVAFSTEENDALIDIDIATALNEPIIQIIRNIIMYGIDSHDDRFDRNKSEEATITLSVYYDEDGLIVEIADDGEGLDLDALTEHAVNKGLILKEDSESMAEEEIMELIFMPNFYSESDELTIAGLARGMKDVVETVRQKLKGDIFVDSIHGQGNTFIIKIPISGAIETRKVVKKVYGFHDKFYYHFDIDSEGECQAKRINLEDVPESVIKKWKETGLLK